MAHVVRLDAPPPHFRALLDPEPTVRARAIERQRAELRMWSETIARTNELLAGNGYSFDFDDDPGGRRRLQQLAEEGRRVFEGTLYGVAGSLWSEPTLRSESSALLFLRWEVEFADEWATVDRSPPWGVKHDILKYFRRRGVRDEQRAELTRLTLAAAARDYRREDRGYAGLVRHLDGPDLRASLNSITADNQSYEPITAFYMEALLDQPDVAVSRHSWRIFRESGELPA